MNAQVKPAVCGEARVGGWAVRGGQCFFDRARINHADDPPSPNHSSPTLLAPFYDDFIATYAHRLSPLAVARAAGVAAGARSSPADAAAFLRRAAAALEDTRAPDVEGPLLYLRALAVRSDIAAAGATDTARTDARALSAALDALPPPPPPSVAAAVHATAASLARADGDASAFYRASLRHLSYVDGSSLPPADRATLAVDVGAAALLADDVHSFGELLLHPVFAGGSGSAGVEDTPTARAAAALLPILQALSDGDLAAFDAAVRAGGPALASVPALAAADATTLRGKAAVCALVALVSNLPPSSRGALPLADIASAAGTDADGAERLVMRAVAAGVLRATMDGVASAVCVSWVAPRVLTRAQAGALAARLRAWKDKAEGAAGLLQGEGVTPAGLLAA